ncbi:PAS domain S-box protein [Methanolobus mangrovi]|uniref:histidine kinase n=1 Tax=Methanolobus mangrovi TaxID=3072977 RepID=A0AA51YK51_9EURY|nr:PAS domain S-box protein [Methanolobus mangrovi]WMW22834.1 PAS domain S-box protein [Methanolobus mangrovi]
MEEDQCRENMEKMQLISFSLDTISDAVFWARSDGQFFYANKAACSLLEYLQEELLAMKVYDVDPTISKELWPEKFEMVKQKGSATLEATHRTKSGRVFPVEITVNYMSYEGNEYSCTIVRDITERKKNEDALKAEITKRRILTEQSADGIVILDQNSKVYEANQRYADMHGYTLEETLKLHIWDWDAKYTREQLMEMTRLANSVGVIHETKHRRKDGTLLDVEISGNASMFGDEKLIFCVCRDISERKQTEEALIAAKQAAEDTTQSKTEFLATMSHELRTPLNSIIGFSDLMLQKIPGELNEKQNNYMDHISKSSKHLLQLINDILDFSKVEAGKMELHYETFYVSDAVEEVRMLIAPLAAKKDITIDMDTKIDPDLSINADRTKFRQILYNLTGNAIKFTPTKGFIKIGVKRSEDMIEVSIKDNGIGIAQENTAKLFQPFKQLDQYNTREHEGTGLGLAIVKKYIELHDGNIWVQSKPGEGSTFAFVIPVEPENT